MVQLRTCEDKEKLWESLKSRGSELVVCCWKAQFALFQEVGRKREDEAKRPGGDVHGKNQKAGQEVNVRVATE